MSSKYMMLIDINSCSGCHACSVSCKAEHRDPAGYLRHKVQTVENGVFPSVSRDFVPTLCQHCTDAPCISSCAVGAITRTEQGAVVIDQDQCVGSGTCVEACPYGAIYFDPLEHTAHKCDFCQDRLEQGENPACVATCPTDAILFGREDDPDLLMAVSTYRRWEPQPTAPRVWYKGLASDTEQRLNRINRTRGDS